MAPPPDLSPEWIAAVRALKHTARGRKVLEHLLEHGTINLYEIETTLHEAHAPSAIRDVKDRGVPIVPTRKVMAGGKMRQEYALQPNAPLRVGMIGRTGFSKDFKKRLTDHYGAKCLICGTEYDPRYLQPDHRVPQRIGGDEPDDQRDVDDYMPLCGPDNRAKSFECERCPNWTEMRVETCEGCYWAHPEDYVHVATRPERREVVVWTGSEVRAWEKLRRAAAKAGSSVADFIKRTFG